VPRCRLGFGKALKAEAGNLLPFANIKEPRPFCKQSIPDQRITLKSSPYKSPFISVSSSPEDPRSTLGVHYPERGEADVATGRATGNPSTQSNDPAGHHAPSARGEIPKDAAHHINNQLSSPIFSAFGFSNPEPPTSFSRLPGLIGPGGKWDGGDMTWGERIQQLTRRSSVVADLCPGQEASDLARPFSLA
jgi:hypothetical protein